MPLKKVTARDLETAYFIPKKFKIGLFRGVRTQSGTFNDVNVDGGIPSCRFRCGDWTDMKAFEDLTGFRPTNQMDRAAEIEKTVTGSVSEYDNEPTSGFKLVEYGLDLYSSERYRNYSVTVRDPRGWDTCMTMGDFFSLLTKRGCGLSRSSEIEGVSFVYSWDASGRFTLIPSDSEEYEKSIPEEYFIEEKKRTAKRLKSDELKVGTVYDFVVGINKLSCIPKTERAVYLGKMKLHSKKDYDALKYYQYVTQPSEYKNGLRKGNSYYAFPWENDEWGKLVRDFERGGEKERHIFVLLKDEYSQTYGYFVDDYFDHYLDDTHNDFALSTDCVKMLDSVGNKIVMESKDQRICPSDNYLHCFQRTTTYSNGGKAPKFGMNICSYAEYTSDELVSAIRKHDRHIAAKIRRAVSEFPTEKPHNLMEWMAKPASENEERRFTIFRDK